MVAYAGTVATAVASGGVTNKLLRGLIDGRVKAMVETYTILGSELSGSTITLGGVLPVGANIIKIELSVSAAQTSATMSVGDAGSATRYASALTGCQTAVTIFSAPGKAYVITGTSDTQILITTGGATLTAGTLYATILYTND